MKGAGRQQAGGPRRRRASAGPPVRNRAVSSAKMRVKPPAAGPVAPESPSGRGPPGPGRRLGFGSVPSSRDEVAVAAPAPSRSAGAEREVPRRSPSGAGGSPAVRGPRPRGGVAGGGGAAFGGAGRMDEVGAGSVPRPEGSPGGGPASRAGLNAAACRSMFEPTSIAGGSATAAGGAIWAALCSTGAAAESTADGTRPVAPAVVAPACCATDPRLVLEGCGAAGVLSTAPEAPVPVELGAGVGGGAGPSGLAAAAALPWVASVAGPDEGAGDGAGVSAAAGKSPAAPGRSAAAALEAVAPNAAATEKIKPTLLSLLNAKANLSLRVRLAPVDPSASPFRPGSLSVPLQPPS
jgi:hypothetical protein